MGPLKQLKRMFEPTRLIATIVMLVCFLPSAVFTWTHLFIICLYVYINGFVYMYIRMCVCCQNDLLIGLIH